MAKSKKVLVKCSNCGGPFHGLTACPPVDHSFQASEFITFLHHAGWTSLTVWADGGHVFELLSKSANRHGAPEGAKKILVQIYPEGHGFEVWRPVSPDGSIAETHKAVAQYGEEV